MVHGFVDPVLELHRIFSAGDMAWCRVRSPLHHLPPGVSAEGLEASSLEVLRGVVNHLPLCFIEVFFSDGDDVVSVDFRSITRRIGLCAS